MVALRSDCTTSLLSSRRMDLHHCARTDGSRMHRSLTGAPTPSTPHTHVLDDEAFLPGQQQTGVLGSVSSTPTPTPRGDMMIGKGKFRTGAPACSEAAVSWKTFLKYFVALLMGYGKTLETNLTRRKKMGFDLYSTGNHKTETGEYYRQSVWGWRRLADFVCEQTGVIAEDNKKFWQSNDGHEVSESEAKEIAKQLKALIKDGTVSKAIHEVEQESEEAERNNKFVEICHKMLREKVERETGKTNTAPADYPKEDHDTWEWIQRKYSYGSSYPFTMEQVESFIEFCEQSNGFRIC